MNFDAQILDKDDAEDNLEVVRSNLFHLLPAKLTSTNFELSRYKISFFLSQSTFPFLYNGTLNPEKTG